MAPPVVAPARTVLVIEDETSIANAVAARLRSEGYAASIATDGPQGVAACEELRPDLVILDLMLPGLDGLEVCRRIQAEHPVPVLMLTARDTESDLVVGLGTGADDYMTKPFSTRELVARVHALIRRAERSSREFESRPLRVGALEIDPASRRVRLHGEAVHLTPTEFDVLLHLARRPDAVVTREQLLTEVWGYEVPSGERTVDSHVRALRRKLGDEVVRTVHGVGYAFGPERP